MVFSIFLFNIIQEIVTLYNNISRVHFWFSSLKSLGVVTLSPGVVLSP